MSHDLEIRPESATRIESRGLLTWVYLIGPMTSVSLVHIREEAHEIRSLEASEAQELSVSNKERPI